MKDLDGGPESLPWSDPAWFADIWGMYQQMKNTFSVSVFLSLKQITNQSCSLTQEMARCMLHFYMFILQGKGDREKEDQKGASHSDKEKREGKGVKCGRALRPNTGEPQTNTCSCASTFHPGPQRAALECS